MCTVVTQPQCLISIPVKQLSLPRGIFHPLPLDWFSGNKLYKNASIQYGLLPKLFLSMLHFPLSTRIQCIVLVPLSLYRRKDKTGKSI